MNAILSFKNVDGEDTENLLCRDDLRDRLNTVHEKIMCQVSLLALQEPSLEVSFFKSNVTPMKIPIFICTFQFKYTFALFRKPKVTFLQNLMSSNDFPISSILSKSSKKLKREKKA